MHYIYVTLLLLAGPLLVADITPQTEPRAKGSPSSKAEVVGAVQTTEVIAVEEDIELEAVPPLTTRELLKMPKNLSRWHMGAVLYTAHDGPLQPFNWRDADDGESPGLLLGDDPSAGLGLIPDVYKFAIELGDYYLVDRFTFKNFSAVGTLQVFASESMVRSDSKQWKALTEPVQFSGEAYVSARFEPTDTKCIMVVFDIIAEGTIGIFGLYGDMSVAETRLPRTREDAAEQLTELSQTEEMTKFNFGSLATGSTVSHLSGGDVTRAQQMNDEDIETYYEFPEGEPENVMIIDLAEQQNVNRISMLFEAPPGVFDLYLTNDLPEELKEAEEEAIEAVEAKEAAEGVEAPSLIREELVEEDMAWLETTPLPEPSLLLASTPYSLGEWLALAMLAAEAEIITVTLPKSFFDNSEHAMQFEVDGETGRFRADFEDIEMRYLIIRFVPDENAPPGSTLRVFEIGIFGDVPEERRRLVRVPVFEFFEAGVDLSPDIDLPDAGDDGGGLPFPPPVVSP